MEPFSPLPSVQADPYDWPYAGGDGWNQGNTALLIIDMQVCSHFVPHSPLLHRGGRH